MFAAVHTNYEYSNNMHWHAMKFNYSLQKVGGDFIIMSFYGCGFTDRF